MANSVLMTVSRDEEERARIMRDEKIELDWQSYMSWARKEGLAQGLAEGRAEGREEGEQKIINLLKSGKSPEEIIKSFESGN